MQANASIYACYGNASVTTDQSHPSLTWNSNYAGVWHLANPTSSVSTYDSITGIYGTNNGPAGTSAGKIDGAGIWGVHSTDGIVTDLTANDTTTISYSIWAYMTGYGGGGLGRYFEKRTTSAQTEELLENSGLEYARAWTGGGTGVAWYWAAPTQNAWHYIVVTYDGSSSSNVPLCYVDGIVQALSSGSSPSGAVETSTDNYVIGNRVNDYARNWAGTLDEFHIAKTILPSSWILTEYNNQSGPSAFYTAGSETSPH
jgi:hypothetical protein